MAVNVGVHCHATNDKRSTSPSFGSHGNVYTFKLQVAQKTIYTQTYLRRKLGNDLSSLLLTDMKNFVLKLFLRLDFPIQ